MSKNKNIKVSDESLHCILEMAGYGIGYWAISASVDFEAKTYTIIPAEHPDSENPHEPIVIPFDKVVGAFWRIATPNEEIAYLGRAARSYALRAVADGFEDGNGDIDAGHVDSELADQIIQVAAWDAVVFG